MGAPSKHAHLRELMSRSWANYEYLKNQQKKGEPVFEVTQLISTFLLAAGHPRERRFEAPLNTLTLAQAQISFGFPLVPIVHSRSRTKTWRVNGVQQSRPFDANTYVGDFIEFLRNAIAHGNIAFPNDDEGEQISLIELRNVYRGQERDSTNLSVHDLEEITEACIRIADALFQAEDKGIPTDEFLVQLAS